MSKHGSGDYVAKLLAVLSHPARVEILARLTRGEKDVSTLAEEMELEPSYVSHALQVLREARLVAHTQVHRRHIYSVTDLVSVQMKGTEVTFDIRPTRGGRVLVELFLPEVEGG